eukprot:TRINITY_DN7189_c0_g1_i1.p1 TRINITY_DN7189_c0_g1~~TRINITY_DN7189_c0_g1_i1.p1  ORF type:complete len:286 (+),score=45.08 TRINITY_DN7189_c0_g1_i1:37-858(+)
MAWGPSQVRPSSGSKGRLGRGSSPSKHALASPVRASWWEGDADSNHYLSQERSLNSHGSPRSQSPRSQSPRSPQSHRGGPQPPWGQGISTLQAQADQKRLKELVNDLQWQLDRSENDAQRLSERVQKLIQARDEQLAASQAERKRLHRCLEQEEVEIHRLRGRGAEMQQAVAAEVAGRQRAEQQLLQPCPECAQLRLHLSEQIAEGERLRLERGEYEVMKSEMQQARVARQSQQHQLVEDMRHLIERHASHGQGKATPGTPPSPAEMRREWRR